MFPPMNLCNLEKIRYLTYRECLIQILGTGDEGGQGYITTQKMRDIMLNIMGISSSGNADCYFSFIDSENNFKDWTLKIMNGIINRYEDEFFVVMDEAQINDIDNYDLIKKKYKKLLNILNYTYDKYSSLMDFYAEKREDLLDGIQRTEHEESENSQSAEISGSESTDRLSKFNDTPQAPDTNSVFEGDGYVSELTKDKIESENGSESSISGSAEISRTYSDERETLIQRLNEIEKKYNLTFNKWLDEFEPLFISEENVL